VLAGRLTFAASLDTQVNLKATGLNFKLNQLTLEDCSSIYYKIMNAGAMKK